MPHAFLTNSVLRVVWSAGATGLQIFFVLSAYLITELLLREQDQTGTIHLGAFFKRRMLRIWPLYFLCIGGYKLATIIHPSTIPFPNGAFLAFVFLAGNWYVYGHDFNGVIGPFEPLWSISVEEQFYLIWPFLMRFGSRRMIMPVCLAFYAAAYVTMYELGQRQALPYASWTHTAVEFQFFATGAILALFLHDRHFVPTAKVRVALLVAAITFITLSVARFHLNGGSLTSPNLVLAYSCVNLGVSALLLSLTKARVPPFLAPLVYLGKISYGLYAFQGLGGILSARLLRHGPSVTGQSMLPFMLTLTITIALAICSYRIFETPFLRLKRHFAYVKARDE